jgi:dipeptidyl-peptidase-4
MQINHFKSILVSFSILISSTLFAQGTKYLNMEEAILMFDKESNKSLRTQNLNALQWLPGGSKYAFVRSGKPQKLVIIDIETNKEDSSVSLESFNTAANTYKTGLNFKSFPSFEWIDNDNIKIFKDNEYLNFNIPAQAFRLILQISKNAGSNEYNYGNQQIAYVENDNIFIVGSNGIKQITNDGGKGIVYGQTVHRNEFGIDKGLFWSPSGNKLAFYRMDESMVSDYAIYDNSKMPAAINLIKYPIAGAKSHHVTVGIYDLSTQKVTYLETGEPKEQYLTNIAWGPDEEYLYMAIVNRGQNQDFINRYNTNSGSLDKILFEERDEKYIEPQHGFYFLPNENNKFIWQSERDGFNHLYLYNTNGKMIRQITSGKWMVTKLIGVDSRGEYAYIEASKESPLERHIYSVNIDNGDIKKLSTEQGTHMAIFNSSFTHFIDAYSSTNVPKRIVIKTHKGDQIKSLLDAPNPLSEYALGETSIFPIINEGTVLYCRMITPPNYDKTKKYPVVVYLYGGPHAQMISNSWLAGSNLWMQLMAQKGYIVFTLDNRGSSNRGHEFESATFRNLGTIEMADQIAGVNYLKNLPYVDANRIAVHGWSFGGFMTSSLMTRQPGVFKVGVAGGPVIDWSLYEIMYTERYMDTPLENPEGYKAANLTNYVNNLQDKLLMIHGCDDDVVLWQHSLLYCKSAVDVGNTYLDYFVYPGHKHNVLGKDRVHLMQKITEYIIENL